MHTLEKSAAEQLLGVARDIKEYQDREVLSDAALLKEFADLGSTKTYKRILGGDLAELDVERQLNNYQRVLELTRIRRDPGDEVIYTDFLHVKHAVLAVKEAYREKSNDRLVILEGATGSGKTATLDVIAKEFPKSIIRADAHGGWKIGNNPLSVMLGDVLEAVKIVERGDDKEDNRTEAKIEAASSIPISYAERKRKLFEALNARKRILAIDEGHEMGPFCLNLVKTIINQTPTVVVLAVYPTLFRRLESRAYDDCIQLTGNRLYERVKIPAPGIGEITTFLTRRGIKFEDADRDACLAKLAEQAPFAYHANWKFIRRFAVRARRVKGALDAKDVVEHILAIEKSRK